MPSGRSLGFRRGIHLEVRQGVLKRRFVVAGYHDFMVSWCERETSSGYTANRASGSGGVAPPPVVVPICAPIPK